MYGNGGVDGGGGVKVTEMGIHWGEFPKPRKYKEEEEERRRKREEEEDSKNSPLGSIPPHALAIPHRASMRGTIERKRAISMVVQAI